MNPSDMTSMEQPETIGSGAMTETTRMRTARATEKAHQTADRVAQGLHSAVDRMGRQAERAMVRGDEMLVDTRQYVHEKPLVALGAAFALGFILSRLMR